MTSRGTAASGAQPCGSDPAQSAGSKPSQTAGPSQCPAAVAEQALGYLNFSSGAADFPFLANLNSLFEAAGRQQSGLPAWLEVSRLLTERLAQLRGSSPAFRDAD